jgi:para-aminobenzoate synthetase component 1
MDANQFKTTMNEWGHKRVPFLFLIDFEMKKPRLFRLHEIDSEELLYALNGKTNATQNHPTVAGQLVKIPISIQEYQSKFDYVLRHLVLGDSYLTNLTTKTPITLPSSLSSIFHSVAAKYKVLLSGEFLCFSPETFVKIADDTIFSFPMKGTIDADVEDAEAKILYNQKELAEHVTIVDLIRNDLSLVARQVEVSRFRYIDVIKTQQKNLLQVSSEIRGILPSNWHSLIGDIFFQVLPAGSVSGAPKKKTCEIIRQAEGEDRGYYTGIVGIFDGKTVDSGVMIRFIEKSGDQLFYRSGGGITTQSNLEEEYQEAIQKVYVPVS